MPIRATKTIKQNQNLMKQPKKFSLNFYKKFAIVSVVNFYFYSLLLPSSYTIVSQTHFKHHAPHHIVIYFRSPISELIIFLLLPLLMQRRHQRIYTAFSQVLTFSPFACLLLLGFIALGLWMIRGDTELMETKLAIGMVFIAATILFTISVQKHTGTHLLKQIVPLGVACIFFLRRHVLDNTPSSIQTVQIILASLLSVLSIVIIPYLSRPKEDEMLYNRIVYLLFQLAGAGIFSVVLGGGIMLAILAVETLFSISIINERYPTIRLLAFGIVGAISFIEGVASGLPEAVDTKKQKRKALLALILSILLAVFGLILYIYLWKILFTGMRPSNEVSFRGFFFAGLVIIASVVLLPELDLYTPQTQRLRQRWYALLLPICVMIAIALRQRVDQYGITEKRYLAIAGLIRLAGISLYMILRKNARLYTLFSSFAVVIIIAGFARPINAASVSYRSQLHRLTSFLSANDLLSEDGTVLLPVTDKLDTQNTEKLAELLGYFVHQQEQWLASLDSRLKDPTTLFTQFGIEETGYRKEWIQDYKNLYLSVTSPRNVAGYSYVYPDLSLFLPPFPTDTDTDISGSFTNDQLTLTVQGTTYTFPLTPLRPQRIALTQQFPSGEITDVSAMTLEQESIKVIISNLSFKLLPDQQTGTIDNLSVIVMVK